MGCTISPNIIDTSIETFYKCVGDSEFKSAGFMDMINTQTGKPMPNMMFNCPLGMMPGGKIYISYKNVQGEMQGPFGIEWSKPGTGAIKSMMAQSMKQMSYGARNSPPATYHFNMGFHLAVFNTVNSQPCEFSKIMYAWDDDKNLDKEFLSANVCDPDNPKRIKRRGGGDIFDRKGDRSLEFPSEANFLAVQATFADGTKGKVWKIKKNKAIKQKRPENLGDFFKPNSHFNKVFKKLTIPKNLSN
jgi:hypothetical protein